MTAANANKIHGIHEYTITIHCPPLYELYVPQSEAIRFIRYVTGNVPIPIITAATMRIWMHLPDKKIIKLLIV